MDERRSPLIPLIGIPLGSILTLAVAYGGYFLFFRSLERFMFHENEQGFLTPMMLRFGYVLLLIAIYLLVERSRASDLIKAIVMTGPVAMLIIIAMILFYDRITVAFSVAAGITLAVLLLLRVFRKPWPYYYAAVVAIAVGLFYSWPS